jgi:ribosome biogenesis protein ERB1
VTEKNTSEEKLHFFIPPNLPPAILTATRALLNPATLPSTPATPSLVKWVDLPKVPTLETPLLSVELPPSSGLVKHVAWHRKGDYFATVCESFLRSLPCFMLIILKASGGGQGGVWIHQVSRRHSQAPFKKIKGSVQLVLFHPSKPHFFVAVRAFALAFEYFFELTAVYRRNVMFGSITWPSRSS